MLHNTVVVDDSNNEAKREKYIEGKRLPYDSFDGLKCVRPAFKIDEKSCLAMQVLS